MTYATGDYVSSVAAADLDGDGSVDLAVTNQVDGSVSVLLNQCGGTFGAPVSYPVGTYPNRDQRHGAADHDRRAAPRRASSELRDVSSDLPEQPLGVGQLLLELSDARGPVVALVPAPLLLRVAELLLQVLDAAADYFAAASALA